MVEKTCAHLEKDLERQELGASGRQERCLFLTSSRDCVPSFPTLPGDAGDSVVIRREA